MSEILFHPSPRLIECDLHHKTEQRLIAFRQLNAELRQELQAALEEEQRLLNQPQADAELPHAELTLSLR